MLRLLAGPFDLTMLLLVLTATEAAAVGVDEAVEALTEVDEGVDVEAVVDLVTVEDEVVAEVVVAEAPTVVASATSRERSRLSKSDRMFQVWHARRTTSSEVSCGS